MWTIIQRQVIPAHTERSTRPLVEQGSVPPPGGGYKVTVKRRGGPHSGRSDTEPRPPPAPGGVVSCRRDFLRLSSVHERSCETLRSVTMWKRAGGPRSASSCAAAAAAAVTCLLVTGMLVVTVGHPSGGEPAEPPAPAATSAKVFSAYFRRLTRERRAVSGPPRSSAAPGPVERLSPADLLVAVKSTGRYHRQRLQLLLDTWISRNMQQVSRWRVTVGYLIPGNDSAEFLTDTERSLDS